MPAAYGTEIHCSYYSIEGTSLEGGGGGGGWPQNQKPDQRKFKGLRHFIEIYYYWHLQYLFTFYWPNLTYLSNLFQGQRCTQEWLKGEGGITKEIPRQIKKLQFSPKSNDPSPPRNFDKNLCYPLSWIFNPVRGRWANFKSSTLNVSF